MGRRDHEISEPLLEAARERLLARMVYDGVWERELDGGAFRWLAGGSLGDDPADAFCAWTTRLHPDDRQQTLDELDRSIASGGPCWSSEYRFRRPDGSWALVAERGVIERDPSGRATRLTAALLDVSRTQELELTLGEPAFEQTPGLLRVVIQTLPVGVAVMDANGDIVLGNAVAARVWGGLIRSGRERLGRSVAAWRVSGRRIAPHEWASQPALTRGETSLNELIDIQTLDGKRKTIQNSAAPIRGSGGRIVGAVVVNEDVTERVEAEESLRKSRQLLVEAESLGNTGCWEFDLTTGAFFSSAGNRRLFFGDDRERPATPDDYTRAVHPDDRVAVLRGREDLYKEGSVQAFEHRVVRPDGTVRVLLGRATLIRDANGQPLRMQGTNADITDRKRAQEELAQRAREQEAIAQLSLSALRGGDLQALFEEAARLVMTTLEVEYGAVFECDPEAGEMHLRAGAGPWIDDAIRRIRVATAPGSMAWFYLQAQGPVVIADLPRETRFAPCELLLAHGVRSGIAVPIGGRDRKFGVLEANAQQLRTFGPDEVNFVWSIANVLASSIEQRRSAEELREKREQLRVLSGILLRAQEAERRAVARELHDDFGQVLTAIKLNLMRKERDDAESIALVDGAIARMRDLAHDLRPPLLDEFGLEAALRCYVEREAKRAGLEFDLTFAELGQRPPLRIETTCFRIAQEALTNVIRHAHARAVGIDLRREGDALALTVRDDGRGFDVSAARRRAASQGLTGMQERVALVSGELRIDSGARGTTVRAFLPVGTGAET